MSNFGDICLFFENRFFASSYSYTSILANKIFPTFVQLALKYRNLKLHTLYRTPSFLLLYREVTCAVVVRRLSANCRRAGAL